MAALLSTNLRIVADQLPPDFSGTPAELFRAFVERLRILSASGSNSFVTGDVEPPNNQGPWLKNGTQWWVFSDSAKAYVPIDLSASITALFVTQEATPDDPTTGEALIWVRTKGNRVLGWYFWDGTIWRPDGQTLPSGPTSARPSDPGDLEQFFDTTINVALIFERGAWRTLSGSPGDVKHVTASILTDALTANPGWEYLGQNSQNYRGKTLGIATKDPGATPASSFSTAGGISARAQGDLVGEETHVISSLEIPQHTHIVGSVNALGANKNANFYRVDNAETFVAPGAAPPNYEQATGALHTSVNGGLPAISAGCVLVTSKQLTGSLPTNYVDAAAAHNNLPPTVYLWALVKL